MMYHHKSGHIAGKDEFVVVLPDGFDPLLGIWVSKMGPICMNGILYAADDTTRMTVQSLKDCLAGQRVAVFGAGMIGLLTGLFAKWAGASEVVIVDSIAERLDTAAKLGLTPLVASVRVPEDIKEKWVAEDAMNTGADIVFQCTGSNYLLQQAFESLREQGVVIDLGFYQQGANHVMFGKEFHHNRLRHICAQIGALPRHQQKDWTKLRLSEETIAFMQEHGPLLKEHLVTHVVPLSKGQEIFDALAARDPSMLQVVLTPEKEQ
jgi:threonine dehydrogenase-like Zn-dependent dehydrogenase